MSGKVLKFILYIAVFILFWNLLDLLWASFISRSGFSFAAGLDLGIPLVAAAVTGYLLILRRE